MGIKLVLIIGNYIITTNGIVLFTNTKISSTTNYLFGEELRHLD